MADTRAGAHNLVAADRVSDDEFGQRRPLHPRDRRTRQHAVGAIGNDFFGARSLQRGGSVAECARRIDDIVDQDAEAPLDIADDVHDFGLACALAALVDDRERGIVQPLGQRPRAHHAADVGRDHHQVAPAIACEDIGRHHRSRKQIIGRNVEKALNLPGMEIDRQHTIRASHGNEIGNQLRRNRGARPRFSVLTRIAEIGNDRRNPLGRGAAQRVDADQQLHQIVIGRIAGRLEHEHVLAADIFVDFDKHFLIGKAAHARVCHLDLKIIGDRLCQRQVGIAGHQFHARAPDRG